MFDIGFNEILVIALVGLIFIGPERLPETVRTISLYIGRFKRTLRETRREIEQQLGADEIRRELHNEEVMKNLEKLRKEVKDGFDETLDFERDLYPPGHHDHDPNNDIDPGEPWRPDVDNDAPAISSTENTSASDSASDSNSISETNKQSEEDQTENKSSQ